LFVSGGKRCGRCKQVKPETEFNRLRDGRQHWCRECFREYFRARGDLHRKQSMDALRRRRAVLRKYLDDYLRAHPCSDCGERDARVLEFDHVGHKTEHIAVLWRLGRSLAELEDEVAQCEVVCVNCHRRRTATRGNWWRLDPDRAPPPTQSSRQTRNLSWVYSRLAASGCVDCGERDIIVLEFDHIGFKRDSVLNLAWSEYALATVRLEAARCEVRCCNCHRRRTAERRADAA
jgi:hypothetical protein